MLMPFGLSSCMRCGRRSGLRNKKINIFPYASSSILIFITVSGVCIYDL